MPNTNPSLYSTTIAVLTSTATMYLLFSIQLFHTLISIHDPLMINPALIWWSSRMLMTKPISRNSLEVALNVLTLYGTESEWILDSSASAHFSGDKDAFKYIIPSNWSSVTSTRSNVHRIEGHGATHGSLPSGEIKTIKNVKYVLRLYCNILFVGKITDKGHIAVVDKYSCVILSQTKSFTLLALGRQDRGMGL